MPLQLVYTAPLWLGVLLGAGLVLIIVRYRTVPGAWALIGLMVAAALWSGAYALEILAASLPTKLLWAKVQYIGIATIPLAWAIFAAQNVETGRWWARPRNRALLGVIPGLTVGLVWTNEFHRLVWPSAQLHQLPTVTMLDVGHGPWFWVNIVFAYSLMLVGSIQLGGGLLASVRLYRWQTWLVLVAIAIPWLANFAYILDLGPIRHVDWTPFSFTIAGLIFAVGLFRFDLGRIVPIAQKAVFDGLADGVVVLDLHGGIVDLNPAAGQWAGGLGAAAIGKPLTKVRPDLAAWVQQADPGRALEVEATGGEAQPSRWYELRVSTLTGVHEAPVGRVVVWHDITQHKQALSQAEGARAQLETKVAERTEALRHAVDQLRHELDQRIRAERRFEEMVEAAPDAMLLVDETGTIMVANAQAEQLFAYRREELQGESIERLIPTRHHAGHRQALQRFLEQRSIRRLGVELDAHAQRKDGSLFPVEVSLGPLDTATGRWVACSIRDISERKRTQLLLQESEQTYRALFENAGDATLLVGLDGAIRRANQTAADLLGLSCDELQARSIFDVVAPSEVEAVRANMCRLQEGHALKPIVRYYLNRAGEPIPVEVNEALVRDPKGQPLFYQHISRDIRERVKAEQVRARLLHDIQQSREDLRALSARLEAVREMERREIAVELHDRVGQNLTGLNLNLQIVQNQLAPGVTAAVRGRLDDALSLVEATTRQVRDVMADLHPPALDEYGLVAALRWYCRNFSARTGISTVVVGNEFEPRLGPAVEVTLFRLVQEALNNVAKHAHASQATVRLETDADGECLTVVDNGEGFDPSRLGGSAGQPHWGVLTMQQRATSVGGQLTIKSAPGQGTQVSVVIGRDGHDN